MRCSFSALCLPSCLALLLAQVNASVYKDPDTGFAFSQTDVAYKLGKTASIRVAIPSNITYGSGYDAVVQVVAPLEIGWAGIAWGGSMIQNPLTVAWSTGTTSAVVSARWATGHTPPTSDPKTTLTLLPKGTKRNSTHWQYTAYCSGCTSYLGSGDWNYTLSTTGSNKVAFAYSGTRPTGTGNTSVIGIHETPIYPSLDFSVAGNAGWGSLVTANLGS